VNHVRARIDVLVAKATELATAKASVERGRPQGLIFVRQRRNEARSFCGIRGPFASLARFGQIKSRGRIDRDAPPVVTVDGLQSNDHVAHLRA
jgi:hypothetical protein